MVMINLVLIGMALLSMCINLMQEQLVEKCRWLAQEIGLSKSDTPVEETSKIPKIEKEKNQDPLSEDFKIPHSGKKQNKSTNALPGALDDTLDNIDL